MKNRKNGVSIGLALVGLLMLSNYSYAGINDKFKQYIGEDSSNLTSLYIIAGVIAVGLIGKLIQHYFMKEEEEEKTSSNVKISQHSHHSHHRHHRHRAVVKKTS